MRACTSASCASIRRAPSWARCSSRYCTCLQPPDPDHATLTAFVHHDLLAVIAGPVTRRGRSVPAHHGGQPPAVQLHEVHFGAAVHQPAVPEPVALSRGLIALAGRKWCGLGVTSRRVV
jgi:hypothetical protein